MVSATDKPAEADLLWEKNNVPFKVCLDIDIRPLNLELVLGSYEYSCWDTVNNSALELEFEPNIIYQVAFTILAPLFFNTEPCPSILLCIDQTDPPPRP